METFEYLVKKQLKETRGKHGRQSSLHEGYAILLEEVEEFWDEVKKKHSKRDPAAMLEELVQIASCAQKTAEDLVIPIIEKGIPLNQ